jgi:hypothetical protein
MYTREYGGLRTPPQPGVLGVTPGIRRGDVVSVWVDMEGKCLKGARGYDGPLLFAGNGVAQLVCLCVLVRFHWVLSSNPERPRRLVLCDLPMSDVEYTFTISKSHRT